MTARRYEMALLRDARSHLTLEGLAESAGIHPALVERLIEFGLVEPVEWAGASPLFDVSVIGRLRVIERLRGDLGINLAGIAVILEMIDRLRAVQCENDLLRSRL
jgi:DNA-binding transcriptional MerR regulator